MQKKDKDYVQTFLFPGESKVSQTVAALLKVLDIADARLKMAREPYQVAAELAEAAVDAAGRKYTELERECRGYEYQLNTWEQSKAYQTPARRTDEEKRKLREKLHDSLDRLNQAGQELSVTYQNLDEANKPYRTELELYSTIIEALEALENEEGLLVAEIFRLSNR